MSKQIVIDDETAEKQAEIIKKNFYLKSYNTAIKFLITNYEKKDL